MALLAILATIVTFIILVFAAIAIAKMIEERKIDRAACTKFEGYFRVHAEAEAEMKKIYSLANKQTRKALDDHFGSSIASLKGVTNADHGIGNRAVSVRW